MTDATVLADALVEAGILESYACSDAGHYSYALDNSLDVPVWADDIITDWRVAGKVLDSIPRASGDDPVLLVFTRAVVSLEESLPRAIIEAWYASQGHQNDD